MVLSIILVLVFALLVYLLLLPLNFYIDTESKQYFIQAGGIAKASVESHKEEFLQIRCRVLFFKWNMYPLKMISRKRKKRAEEKKMKTKLKRIGSKKIGMRKIFGVLRSFQVKRFYVHLDTGDVIWNAKLYPLCSLLNYYGGNVFINFNGRNQLALHMQNRPINIIKSIIHSKN